MRRTIEETLRDLPRAMDRAGIEPDLARLAQRVRPAASRPGGRRWLLGSVATAAALVLAAAFVRLQQPLHPAQTVHERAKTRTYAMARGQLGPLLASSPVPPYLPILEGQLTPPGTIDASFRITPQGYRVTLGFGPKRPEAFNSPQAQFGNAELLMIVTGARLGSSLDLSQWIPLPKSVPIPNAAQGTVDLGHGIVGTTFTAGAGQSAVEAVTWREGGWTFWVGPWAPAGWGNPVKVAAQQSALYLNMRLPGKNGIAVFAAGQDAPSEATFTIGSSHYAVEALGYRAVQYAARMAPAR